MKTKHPTVNVPPKPSSLGQEATNLRKQAERLETEAINPTAPSAAQQASSLSKQATNLRKEAEKFETEAINLTASSAAQQAANEIRRRKGKVAVFLGAGASKTFGWPLTNELFPIILDGLVKEDLFEDARINTPAQNAADRRLLRKTLLALCPGMALTRTFLKGCRERLPLVTSLLSMLDFSLSAGQSIVLGLTPEELKDARSLLERAIYEAIAHETVAREPNYWPPRRSNKLAPLLANWLDKSRPDTTQVGVITSNYDVAMEQAWHFNRDSMTHVTNLGMDFGFNWTWPSNKFPPDVIRRPAAPKRRLYKLHGSTNWLRCGLCDRIYVNPEVDIAVYAYDRKIEASNTCHCGHAKLEVQIVSPSFVREMRSPNLISVWQQALDWLRASDDWVIIGYSFPDEDLNIRSLFTRAFASRESPPFITAVQFGTNNQTRIRYEAFFPSKQLTFLNGGLEVFLQATNGK
jgi:NAD-dependent SIR2 family protein deacetylase